MRRFTPPWNHEKDKASDFIWAAGIEDTFVPQTRKGHRSLDEYELMGHYEHWREDLSLCRELGLHAVRWGVPWYKVEPEPNKFEWQWVDEVLRYLVEELKIAPMIDLMHYGCPDWLASRFWKQRLSALRRSLRRSFCRAVSATGSMVHAAQ